MSKSSSLKILQALAQQQTDAAAKQLGKINYQQQEAEKKLQLLLQYRNNYQLHFQHVAGQGIDNIEWRNFIAFMNKLDAAIAEQQQAILYVQHKKNVCSDEFLSHQRKLKSYDTLAQRQQHADNLRQMKNDQKLQDEFASNSLQRESFPPKTG